MFIIQSISLSLVLSFSFVQLIKADPQILPFKTGGCGSAQNPQFVCLFECPSDTRCQSLLWDFSQLSCGCAAQFCPDGKIYTSYDYTKDSPLNDDQIAQQPHVKYPCDGCVPEQIAPQHQQIGDCSHLQCVESETGDYQTNGSGNAPC